MIMSILHDASLIVGGMALGAIAAAWVIARWPHAVGLRKDD